MNTIDVKWMICLPNNITKLYSFEVARECVRRAARNRAIRNARSSSTMLQFTCLLGFEWIQC